MTVGASALGPVAIGVYGALTVSSYSGAAGVSPGGVYDEPPQATTTYPYTTFTVREQDGGGATFGRGGKEVTVRLRVWDSATAYEGAKRLHAAVNKAAELLHHTLPALTGFTTVLVMYDGAFPLPDQTVGKVTVKGIEATFRLLVSQN